MTSYYALEFKVWKEQLLTSCTDKQLNYYMINLDQYWATDLLQYLYLLIDMLFLGESLSRSNKQTK